MGSTGPLMVDGSKQRNGNFFNGDLRLSLVLALEYIGLSNIDWFVNPIFLLKHDGGTFRD